MKEELKELIREAETDLQYHEAKVSLLKLKLEILKDKANESN